MIIKCLIIFIPCIEYSIILLIQDDNAMHLKSLTIPVQYVLIV